MMESGALVDRKSITITNIYAPDTGGLEPGNPLPGTTPTWRDTNIEKVAISQ